MTYCIALGKLKVDDISMYLVPVEGNRSLSTWSKSNLVTLPPVVSATKIGQPLTQYGRQLEVGISLAAKCDTGTVSSLNSGESQRFLVFCQAR